ncbi:glutamate synthase-related protein [Streptacidiphilus jiangxiensis]|uniref:Glutamate synthase conserved region-containing protein n=1 Tax=Streptacidiphilus jiangxiensis TaxID=235985 RepID=A0A1H7VM66_STRJI|nr:glutamate synthase-related protein [Streptacidiphilus jiangxiensis]SEM09878.1 glutamate synthase conserved region-containing protein [Streptacidiphilus jiangxiensis]
MTDLQAPGFAEEHVRARARHGAGSAFPDREGYGSTLFGGAAATLPPPTDPIDRARLVPPVFVPLRLERLFDLGREPLSGDVDLTTDVGGLRSTLPVYISAFGSTAAASDLGLGVAQQAGRLGIPMVIGENIVPVSGYGRMEQEKQSSLLGRITQYIDAAPPDLGGVVVQQSTEDANAEVWNLVYSDPAAQPLLTTGRLAFELKVGQGAKPGVGGMTLVPRARAAELSTQYDIMDLYGPASESVLRCSSPGTFSEEILRQQIRLMRNNYPRCRVWVKLPPGRDVHHAAAVAWAAGADSVTVDGAEGGTGWAPSAFLDQVGLPLAECLDRVTPEENCLLVSGRVWEGARAVKCLALGARAVGLGRAALIATDEDPKLGLENFLECLALEMRLLISALGKYRVSDLSAEDVWMPSAR